MNRLLRWLILIVLLLILIGFARRVNGQTSPCPEGSYQIGEKNGEVICKLQPTGCPWADSVPLGPPCDKLEPKKPEVQLPAAVSPKRTPPSTSMQQSWGK